MAHGANVDHCCTTYCHFTPLAAAAAAQCLASCKMLVAAGASVARSVDLIHDSALSVARKKDINDFICDGAATVIQVEKMTFDLSVSTTTMFMHKPFGINTMVGLISTSLHVGRVLLNRLKY